MQVEAAKHRLQQVHGSMSVSHREVAESRKWGTSLFAMHCRKFVLPQPLAPRSPYLRPMVSSILQSEMSSTPFRLMLNPLILMSLDVGRDVSTPVGVANDNETLQHLQLFCWEGLAEGCEDARSIVLKQCHRSTRNDTDL